MTKVKTFPWDPAEQIETEEDMAVCLSVALEDDDTRLLLATLNDIAKAKARLDAGTSGRNHGEELPFVLPLSETATDISTILKVVRELGLQLHAKVAASKDT